MKVGNSKSNNLSFSHLSSSFPYTRCLCRQKANSESKLLVIRYGKYAPIVQSVDSLTKPLVTDLFSLLKKHKLKCAHIFAEKDVKELFLTIFWQKIVKIFEYNAFEVLMSR